MILDEFSGAPTKQLAAPRQIHYSLGGVSYATIFLPRWRSYIPDLVITHAFRKSAKVRSHFLLFSWQRCDYSCSQIIRVHHPQPQPLVGPRRTTIIGIRISFFSCFFAVLCFSAGML